MSFHKPGRRLGISPVTVNDYLKRARSRFGACKSSLLIVCALLTGKSAIANYCPTDAVPCRPSRAQRASALLLPSRFPSSNSLPATGSHIAGQKCSGMIALHRGTISSAGGIDARMASEQDDPSIRGEAERSAASINPLGRRRHERGTGLDEIRSSGGKSCRCDCGYVEIGPRQNAAKPLWCNINPRLSGVPIGA